MHWYRLLKQAAQPYGYWIGPDGTEHDVRAFGHEQAAAKILQYPEWEIPSGIYEEMLDNGYIRIAFLNNQMNIQSYNLLNTTIARKIKMIAQDYGLIQGNSLGKVYLDMPGVNSNPRTVSELMQSLQGTRSKVAAGPYGYWMSPSGQLEPVINFEGHWDTAYNILGASGDEEGLDMGVEDPVGDLFGKGWIKLITQGEFVVDYIQRPNGTQGKELIALAEDTGYLESNLVRNVYINGEVPTNRREFNHYIINSQPRMASNWYRLQKQAQIWQTAHDDDNFLGMISSVYELEYKFNMMKQRQFNGMPQRHARMLENLEEELIEHLNVAKGVLENTLRAWLASHAITEPSQWASARTTDEMGGDMWEYDHQTAFGGVLGEYSRYKYPQQTGAYNGPNETRIFHDIISDIAPHINEMPHMKSFMSVMAEGRKEMYYNDLSYEGFEEFGQQVGMEFSSEEEAQNYIEDMEPDSTEMVHEITDLYDYDLFVEGANSSGVLEGIARELYQFAVFPLWYSYWSGMGIDSTREIAEEAYSILEGANSVQELSSAVNLAINTVHQNGQMIEYIETYGGLELGADTSTVQGWLQELTNRDVEDWNEELREVGVQI
tara:strand:- start:854 stop:2668 length:1815 start_codon:yes stop_codon:yes gene_type:complete